MALFKDMLSSDESLFRDALALDYEYLPKIMPYREQEQRYIASCIRPLFQKRNGKNLFIFGPPGIGKTAATKWVLRDLEEETDEIIPIHINCWQKNTTFKIMLEICDILGYKFVQNKKTGELFGIVKSILNKQSVVFVFDEIDKLEEFDFLYMILEDIYRKSVFLITNFKEWLVELDERIRSRLTLDKLEFRQYNEKETEGILKHRMGYAFVAGVWDEDAFKLIADKAAELKDIRCGLYLMKEACNIAESKSSRKITLEHAKAALNSLDEFSVKKTSDLESDTKLILSLAKKNSGKKIGDLFEMYQKIGGDGSYKTFQRKIDKLLDGGFVSVKKVEGGKDGRTSVINYVSVRKLTEF